MKLLKFMEILHQWIQKDLSSQFKDAMIQSKGNSKDLHANQIQLLTVTSQMLVLNSGVSNKMLIFQIYILSLLFKLTNYIRNQFLNPK